MKKMCIIFLSMCMVIFLCSCASTQAEIADTIEELHGVEGKSKEEHEANRQSEWDSLASDIKFLFNLLTDNDTEEDSEEKQEENNTDESLLDYLLRLFNQNAPTSENDDEAPEDENDDIPEEEPESAEDIEYNNKVDEFLNNDKYKDGATWTGANGTEASPHSGTGCNAYASEFAKLVFNHDSPRTDDSYTDADEIRDGDIIYVEEVYGTGQKKPHWIVVISREGEQLTTTEGNWEGKVVNSDTKYTVQDGKIYINGKPFRKIVEAYHHK